MFGAWDRCILGLGAGLTALVSGCAGLDCEVDADCGAGRVCRLGLCALGGATEEERMALEEEALACRAPLSGELILNEVLADPPPGADIDGDGVASPTGDEFVEIVNVASEPVSLARVEVQVNARRVGVGARCLDPDTALVYFGSQGLPVLPNHGAEVALLIDGSPVQVMSYGREGGRDTSLVLNTELSPASGWGLHDRRFETAYSPGTCGSGRAFPGCDDGPDAPDLPDGPDASDTLGPEDDAVAQDALPSCDAPPPSPGELRINELLADPGREGTSAGNDANQDGRVDAHEDEFVELLSVADGVRDIGGLEVRDASGVGVVVPDGTCLAPGQPLLVFGRYEGGGDFGGALAFGGGGTLSLNNRGDTVRVTRRDGLLLESLTYGREGDHAESLSRAPDADFDAPLVRHSAIPEAEGRRMSPGACASGIALPACLGSVGDDLPEVSAGDCRPPREGELVFVEVNRAPGGTDFNGDGVADNIEDEFVEIANPTGEALSLEGLELWDIPMVRHVFGPRCLRPGEVVVVFGGGEPAPSPPGATFTVASTGGLGLNDTGLERVWVQTPEGEVLAEMESTQTRAFAPRSWVRAPDCVGPDWIPHPPLGAWHASPGHLSDGGLFGPLSCAR